MKFRDHVVQGTRSVLVMTRFDSTGAPEQLVRAHLPLESLVDAARAGLVTVRVIET